MIRGMLKAYGDPHSTFVEPVQHEIETNRLAGNFGGIGVQLDHTDEGFIILYPYPDSPAQLAGIQDGDHLLMVDGIEIKNFQPLDEVKVAIRGPEGETVKLEITRHQQSDPIEVNIKRESIPLPSLTWHTLSDESRVGVIEINIISANTPDEVTRAVEDLKDRGANYIIIDLRGNSGGLLSAGVDTARLFIPKGIILKEQTRDRGIKNYNASRDGPFVDIPLVVLVDHGTASASEIIAGALQARGRAVIIGEPTYGKDSIQLVFKLNDGSSLHITSARWWIPNLDPPINENGIQPDIIVNSDITGPDSAFALAKKALLEGE
jgi:carboxyl-terminal processing protease